MMEWGKRVGQLSAPLPSIHSSVTRTYGGCYVKKTVHLVVVSAAPAMASGPSAPACAAQTTCAAQTASSAGSSRQAIGFPLAPSTLQSDGAFFCFGRVYSCRVMVASGRWMR